MPEDGGRLKLTNNESERELRRIAVGRKACLFIGIDDHARAAGNLHTLVASAGLHRLDPEVYLRDLPRVFPHRPRDRSLELAPRYWLATRARLAPTQLERELGALDVSPPPSSEQPAADWAYCLSRTSAALVLFRTRCTRVGEQAA